MRFIKLSNIIINTSKIITIRKYNNMYRINILHFDIGGFILFGSGNINFSGYNIITEWIEKLK